MSEKDSKEASVRDWQIYIYCDVLGRTQAEVAEALSCCRKTVQRRLALVRHITERKEFAEDVRKSMLSLWEKAIHQVENKIDEGDVNVLNAFLKGTGIYETHEKRRAQVDVQYLDYNPDLRLADITYKIAKRDGKELSLIDKRIIERAEKQGWQPPEES